MNESIINAINKNYNSIRIYNYNIPRHLFEHIIFESKYNKIMELKLVVHFYKYKTEYEKVSTYDSELYYNENIINFSKKYKLTEIQIKLLNFFLTNYSYDYIRNKYKNNNITYLIYLHMSINLVPLNNMWTYSLIPKNIGECEFDINFYYQLYPINKNIPDVFNNFMKHGLNNEMIGNHMIFEIANIRQDFLLKTEIENLHTKITETHETHETFIILTRTSRRKHLFDKCYQSIHEQTYTNYIHIVSYDTIDTFKYVSEYTNIDLINLCNHNVHPNKYFDYFFEYIKNKKYNGWIVILDDDDSFISKHSLMYLNKINKHGEHILIWKYHRQDRFIYPVNNNPILGSIATCSYSFHTSVETLEKNIWDKSNIGDYCYFQYLYYT